MIRCLCLVAAFLLLAPAAQAQRAMPLPDSTYETIGQVFSRAEAVALTQPAVTFSAPNASGVAVDTISIGTVILPYRTTSSGGTLYTAIATQASGHVGWAKTRELRYAEARTLSIAVPVDMMEMDEAQWRAAMLETARKNEKNTRVMKYVIVGGLVVSVVAIVAAASSVKDSVDELDENAMSPRQGVTLTW